MAVETYRRLVALRPSSAVDYLDDVATENCVDPARTRARSPHQRERLGRQLADLANEAADRRDGAAIKTLLGRARSLGGGVSASIVVIEAALERCGEQP